MRALSSRNLSVELPASGSVCAKLVRNPAPTVTGPSVTCARDGRANTRNPDSKNKAGAHRRAMNARSLRTHGLGMGECSPLGARSTCCDFVRVEKLKTHACTFKETASPNLCAHA